MVSNHTKALQALHRLLIQGRIMAFEGISSEQLAWFFDDIEYLPALMLEERNADERFSDYLEGTCRKFDCNHIFAQYRSGLASPRPKNPS
jgi:hypothetical protein